MSSVSRPELFDRRTLIAVIVLAGLSFLAAIYFGTFGEFDRRIGIAGAHGYSSSAVGHSAFVELLRKRGYAVVQSRADSAIKADGGVLLRLEPRRHLLERALDRDWEGEAGGRDPMAIALPKRFARTGLSNPDWATHVGLLSEDAAQVIVDILDTEIDVVRLSGEKETTISDDDGNRVSLRDAQLLAKPLPQGWRSVAESRDGVLVARGRVGGRIVYLISDPDMFANHGIDDESNAEFAVALIDRMAQRRDLIVVDETIHGFELGKDFWRSAFSPPFLGISLVGTVFLVFLILRASVRFGRPDPPPRPFGSGKAALIRNTCDLLLFGGYGAQTLSRYRDAVLRDVADRANLPRTGGVPDRDALRAVDRKGGAGFDAVDAEIDSAMAGVVDEIQTVTAARALAAWKKEILHGR